jgi:hypothetical protein
MGYRPPKGVRPPQLEGKRTGRPRGVRNYANEWQLILWVYYNLDEDWPPWDLPPIGRILWAFAKRVPRQFKKWVRDCGRD